PQPTRPMYTITKSTGSSVSVTKPSAVPRVARHEIVVELESDTFPSAATGFQYVPSPISNERAVPTGIRDLTCSFRQWRKVPASAVGILNAAEVTDPPAE